MMTTSQKVPVIWVDLDNSPHVPFFTPILHGLREEGIPVWVTARNTAQVEELVSAFRLEADVLGHSFGRNRLGKGIGTLLHAGNLFTRSLRHRLACAASHGSRSQVVAAWMRHIPSAVFYDYEKADYRLYHFLANRFYAPEGIDQAALINQGLNPKNLSTYPGLKEHLALLTFDPNTLELERAGIPTRESAAVIRPEAPDAHYLRNGDAKLLEVAISKVREWGMRPVLLPRDPKQKRELAETWADDPDVVIPTRPIHGMNLLYHARVLISGGGTMNREAAVLGVPTISIFRGPVGSLDQQLINEGRIMHVPDIAQLKDLDPPSVGLGHNLAAELKKAQLLRDWIVAALIKMYLGQQ